MPKKGYKQTKEHINNVRNALLGKHPSEITRLRLIISHLGQHPKSEIKKGEHRSPDTEFKKGQIPYNKGLFGENNPTYRGGRRATRERIEEKRRGFGFIPLNDWLPGSEGHHINKYHVIYIPKEMHRSIYHSIIQNINMDKINKLAIDFMLGD